MQANINTSSVVNPGNNPCDLQATLSDAFRSGLPPFERVRDLFLHLSRSIEADKPGGKRTYPNGRPLLYTEATHKKFQLDFRQDTSAMVLRLQLIKIHLARDICFGRHSTPRKGGDFFDNDPPKIRELKQLCTKETLVTDDPALVSASIIALYNGLVPESLKLKALDSIDVSTRAAIMCTLYDFTSRGKRDEEFRQQLDLILVAVNRTLARLTTMSTTPLLFDLDEPKSSHEKVLAQSWDEYRLFVKQLSALYEQDSWFSPTSRGTSETQLGPKQGSVTPMITDYQRWSISLTRVLESTLHGCRIGEQGYLPRIESTLASSGMGALHSILDFLHTDWSDRRGRSTRRIPYVASIGDIYFEVDDVVSSFCSKLKAKPTRLDPVDSSKVIDYIKQDLPDIIFAAPLTNSFYPSTINLTQIFESLKDDAWLQTIHDQMYFEGMYPKRHITFVIDNTMLGPTASWLKYRFSSLPQFVRILSFESLIKFGQDGLDLASAGLVTRIGESVQSDFLRVFRKGAYSISELSLHRLMLLHSDSQLERKFERHSRNTDILVSQLDNIVCPSSYVQSVHHPHASGYSSHVLPQERIDLAGGLLTLELKSDFTELLKETQTRAKEGALDRLAQAFTSLVLFYAKETGISVNVGSSFGFNTTRIAIYHHLGEPSGRGEVRPYIPHLRIAPGTENIKDILLVAAVIRRANEVFSQAIWDGPLYSVADRIPRLL